MPWPRRQTHPSAHCLFSSSIQQILPHLETGYEQENICGWKAEVVIQACLGLGEDALGPLLNKQLPPSRRGEVICLSCLTLLPSDLQGFRHLPGSKQMGWGEAQVRRRSLLWPRRPTKHPLRRPGIAVAEQVNVRGWQNLIF